MSMHLNPSFLSLPRELTSIICEDVGCFNTCTMIYLQSLVSQLDLNDLKHMRLTCKTLANFAACLVLSHITISAKGKTVEELVSEFQFVTNPERAAMNCSSEITFGDFSTLCYSNTDNPVKAHIVANT